MSENSWEGNWILHYRKEMNGEFLKPNYDQFVFNTLFVKLAETGHFDGELKVDRKTYEKRLDRYIRFIHR